MTNKQKALSRQYRQHAKESYRLLADNARVILFHMREACEEMQKVVDATARLKASMHGVCRYDHDVAEDLSDAWSIVATYEHFMPPVWGAELRAMLRYANEQHAEFLRQYWGDDQVVASQPTQGANASDNA